MFDLKPCVHFHKKVPVRVQIEDELNCTCIIVSDSFCSLNCRVTNLTSNLLSNIRRGLFYYFLMSSLDWTISFIKMNVIFELVPKYLNLNMSWFCYIFFDYYSIITKGFEWLSLTWLKGFVKVLFPPDYSHTFSSTSWYCFNKNWVLNLLCLFIQIFSLLILFMISRNYWNVSFYHNFFRLTFTSHWNYSRRWWADKFHTVPIAFLGEFSILW
jgi:hypothetical protein